MAAGTPGWVPHESTSTTSAATGAAVVQCGRRRLMPKPYGADEVSGFPQTIYACRR
jgi:hypothetical protein